MPQPNVNARFIVPANRVWLLALLFTFAFAGRGLAYVKTFPLRLTPPTVTNGTVQLSFDAEAGVEYVAEALTNLQTWIPVATNSDPQISRVFDLGPAADVGIFRVTRKELPVFAAAIATVNSIDLNGNQLKTDSYDSSNPVYSTNGLYPFSIPSKQKDNGHVITDSSLVDSLGMGLMQIKGMIRTGPTGTVAITTNTLVGSKSWVEGNTNGIQPGYVLNDMNVLFPLPTLPGGAYVVAGGAGVVNGVLYDRILGTGDYYISSIGGSGAHKIYVSGDARLYVPSSINMSGSDVIRIATNASLKLYMGGAIAKIGGLGVIVESGNAAAFYYFGLAGNVSLDWTGNNPITAVYAPVADFKLGGGNNDFIGACIAKSLTLNGNFYFHFDEDLMRSGPKR
jgi:hypothetical protein